MKTLIYIDELKTSESTLVLSAQWLQHMPAEVALLIARDQALQDKAITHLSAAVGCPISVKVARGDPVEAVQAECEVEKYDLLIMAPAGRGRLERWLKRSRLEQTVHHVNTSVLIARQSPPAIRNILVSLSTATHSLVDVQVAVCVARAFKANLTMLHVVSQLPLTFTRPGQDHLNTISYLNSSLPGVDVLVQALQVVAAGGVEPHLLLREGLVRDEIVRESCQNAYDLIVIGAHAGERWLTLILEDIADHVVRHCPISTLVVWGQAVWVGSP